MMSRVSQKLSEILILPVGGTAALTEALSPAQAQTEGQASMESYLWTQNYLKTQAKLAQQAAQQKIIESSVVSQPTAGTGDGTRAGNDLIILGILALLAKIFLL